MTPTPCPHPAFAWHPAPADEAGWTCEQCGEPAPGEPPGYSPLFDVARITDKVTAILMDLHNADLVYVSNSSDGESIAGSVAEKCVAYGYYDQGTILRYIMAVMHDGAYWKRVGDAVRAGADPRDRCHCGKLATSFSLGGKDRPTVGRCAEHRPAWPAGPHDPEGPDTIDPWEAFGNWVEDWRAAHPEDGRSELDLIEEYGRQSTGEPKP